MLDLLERIRERNFGHQLDYRTYTGTDKAEQALLDAGVETYSLFCDGKDIRVPLHSFNASRSEEKIDEFVDIVSQIIKAHN